MNFSARGIRRSKSAQPLYENVEQVTCLTVLPSVIVNDRWTAQQTTRQLSQSSCTSPLCRVCPLRVVRSYASVIPAVSSSSSSSTWRRLPARRSLPSWCTVSCHQRRLVSASVSPVQRLDSFLNRRVGFGDKGELAIINHGVIRRSRRCVLPQYTAVDLSLL